jgi:hypothetical protein
MSHSKDETSEVSIEGTTSPLSERVNLISTEKRALELTAHEQDTIIRRSYMWHLLLRQMERREENMQIKDQLILLDLILLTRI